MDVDTATMEKTCQRCEAKFIPSQKWQRFCCPDCRDRYWRDIRQEV